jgi:flagellar protein FlaG
MVNSVNNVNQPQPSPERPAEGVSQTKRIRNDTREAEGGREQRKDISGKKDFSDVRETRAEKGKTAESAANKSLEQLEEIRDAINDALKDMNIGLDFDRHEETDKMVVKVMNRMTDEVIRQIPPEAMLEVARRMEEMSGLLIEEWG